MDRTSWLGIIVCFVVFVGLEWYTAKYYPPPPPKPHVASMAATTPATATSMTSATPAPVTPPGTPLPPTATFTYLENDAIKVTFTSLGAAITEVDLKLHRADNGGNVVLNEHSRSNVMAVTGWPGADQLNFDAQPNGDSGVTFTAQMPNGLKWQRIYAFGKATENDSGLTGMVRVMFRKIA